jgi:hypothetical protein
MFDCLSDGHVLLFPLRGGLRMLYRMRWMLVLWMLSDGFGFCCFLAGASSVFSVPSFECLLLSGNEWHYIWWLSFSFRPLSSVIDTWWGRTGICLWYQQAHPCPADPTLNSPLDSLSETYLRGSHYNWTNGNKALLLVMAWFPVTSAKALSKNSICRVYNMPTNRSPSIKRSLFLPR